MFIRLQQDKKTATVRSKIDIQIENTTHNMGSISAESFIAGFAYGGTTVLVGQPFETIKTLRQVQSASSARAAAKGSIFQTASNLYSTSGIRGFYRGGVPLLLGGGLMVS